MMAPEVRNLSTRNLRFDRHSRWITGLALIAMGLLVLAEQYVETAWMRLLFLPALGLIFHLWGIAARSPGLLIPGGVLSGIGLGVILNDGLLKGLNSDTTAGVFLLSFALGWGCITLLSTLFTNEPQWWPLIPGVIMAVIGGALLGGGVAMEVLNFIGIVLGHIWPLSLVALGLYFLLRRKESQA